MEMMSSWQERFRRIISDPSHLALALLIGALVGSVIIIALRSVIDIPTAIIAIASILSLIYIKKMQEPYIIGAAAIIGLLIKAF